MGNPSDDEKIALVKAAFPGAEVVEIREIQERPKPLTGIEMWERCWAREAAELEDYTKMIHPFREELQKVQDVGRRVVVYAMLRRYLTNFNVRLRELGKRERKKGWAAVVFKAQYGVWPNSAWEAVPEMQPDVAVLLMVHAHELAWRKELRARENGTDREALGPREIADELQQGEEGSG